MSEPFYRIRPGIHRRWIQYTHDSEPSADAFLRAGVSGAYLPRIRLELPHHPQAHVSYSLPCCLAMVMEYQGRPMDPDYLAFLLRTDEAQGSPARNLLWLRAWGIHTDFPEDLQFFRDGTDRLNQRMETGRYRLVYRWEERWLRYVADCLRKDLPPILFVDLGRISRRWRGLRERHAVVLAGGDGRQAWIHDPASETGPVRIGLSTLMDALLPGEPLAARVSARPPLDLIPYAEEEAGDDAGFHDTPERSGPEIEP